MSIGSNIESYIKRIEKCCDNALKVAQQELLYGALEVEEKAKEDAPVDTGLLMASISTTKIQPNMYEVGTNVEYAPYVEFGTVYQSPQPFLLPAYNKVAKELKSNIQKAVIKELKRG
jgi:HK97 gp10 family phage protein